MSLTLRDRVAHFFQAHPGEWIDGRVFMQVGGAYASRSRIAECRTQLGMNIQNQQRRFTRPDGSRYVISEYKFVPPVPRVAELMPMQESV